MRDLDRAGIHIFVLVGKAETTGCKPDDAKQNENNSDNRRWFHRFGEPFQAWIESRSRIALEVSCIVLGAMLLYLHEMHGKFVQGLAGFATEGGEA
jgi:hypothetical protein